MGETPGPSRCWKRGGRLFPDDAQDRKMGCDAGHNLTMNYNSSSEGAEKRSHNERVREQYDTKNLSAIMARFYNAVSWREE
jgi:hypothetical protein